MIKPTRKKFLLHACCAPCGVAVIDELRQTYDLTVFFYNPNIYPLAEYEKRKAEIVRVCKEWDIPMVDGDYENEKWFLAVKGLEQEPEGGKRCSQCFMLRLKESAELAKKLKCDFFSTTLTMGRYKRADIINPIGAAIGEHYGVKFHEEDWKKKGRYEKRNAFIKEKNIYTQNYCGCLFSLKAAEERQKTKNQKKS